MTDATSDPNVPDLPALPPGGQFRWKIKSYYHDGYGSYYDLKVCLQAKSRLNLFWYTVLSYPCPAISNGQRKMTMVESVEHTAKKVWKRAVEDAQKANANRRLKGVYRTGNY